MILQTLKKIYPNKSETALKELEQDIRKCINGEIGVFELVDFAAKLVKVQTTEEKLIINKKGDSKPSWLGDESSFLCEKHSEKKDERNGKSSKKRCKKQTKECWHRRPYMIYLSIYVSSVGAKNDKL